MASTHAYQVGKSELPSSLLQTSEYVFPYLGLFSLSTEATGAGAIKSRSNITRRGLVDTL